MLDRLFPRSARSAARRLALETALVRHQAALEGMPQAQHLFDLGAEVEAQLQDISLEQVDLEVGPIQDVETLAKRVGRSLSDYRHEVNGTVVRVVTESGGDVGARAGARAGRRATPLGVRVSLCFPSLSTREGAL